MVLGQVTMHIPRILIDTNVLVYPFDAREPGKALQAQKLLGALSENRSGLISVQSLAEFVSATRKLDITPAQAQLHIGRFAQVFAVLDLTLPVVLEAIRGVRDHQLAYYDAQIWATAKLNQISAIFSEDFHSGATLESVRFVNPFDPAFNVTAWT